MRTAHVVIDYKAGTIFVRVHEPAKKVDGGYLPDNMEYTFANLDAISLVRQFDGGKAEDLGADGKGRKCGRVQQGGEVPRGLGSSYGVHGFSVNEPPAGGEPPK